MSDSSSIRPSSDGDVTQADLEHLAGGELENLPPAPDGTPDEGGQPDPDEVFTAPEGSGPYADRDAVTDERTGSAEV
ncbi:hypothetical protein [Microbacterium hatanonis]|jgi:hypothetical protein|uniref:Uncharacterized protein n=1 Tax=Microbacterium hatanonis TaxID=404366 RepID=A0A5C8I4L7_9MICO|nr:hypothetical protein [Microbacterium hatanonis]TXK12813.1 hypothetical protein FVP77_04985 [Microbacterium hatanonis]